jgi:hypothetical protein
MRYLGRTIEQNNALAYQKQFLETKFGFEVFQPQFDKVPNVSILINQQKISKIVSNIEEILLTHSVINTKFDDINEINILQSRYSKLQCETYDRLNEFSILRANRICISYMTIYFLSHKLPMEVDIKDKDIESKLDI